ncbi:thyrotropin-releasing hormone receptor-like [Strongylocentrotus purpuratus]|uniref:G-protein coupled receptors family 1 profile domain-containing protein n=1 Tax=Strongylocentrotus purpuratus TaxID=7668 RepID=A0A7M7RBB9_STRPU|nr:thyrotropin-releasing hormone receptor-like [Strongylocentrotus purpuratus]|eukprot:XP_792671.1 PREDICTED: thyrotropin-releasing hormone receptor-like [Strongylocentrotus purpuratus]
MAVTTIDWTDSEQSLGNLTELSVIAFHHRAIVASILIALTPIGLFGNALVIIAVVVAKKLRTVTNILVINLAVTDFITCLCFPFLSVDLLSRTGSYHMHDIICVTTGGVFVACVGCSSLTLLAIAFVRWYVITRSVRGHQGIHTPKKVVALVVIIWTESVSLVVLPILLGIGTIGYFKYLQTCGALGGNLFGMYYLVFLGIHIAIAMMLTLIFYLLVLRHVLRHRKQIRNMFTTAGDIRSDATLNNQSQASSTSRESRPPKINAISKMEVEITKNLFVVVGVLLICSLPQSINLMIPGDNALIIYSTMIILANSAVNPIIYGFKHPIFKEIFKSLLWPSRIA